ncbi:helix-turn-helix transcriptional regulator [Acetobacter musti]|uniref:helix-turn-helix transcriptional regulator n=1 Tax=Acetobacter musti TaxID=864732 RepID=UPI0018E9239D|nr:MarR family transcriptional regulator [Acetobacter musti]
MNSADSNSTNPDRTVRNRTGQSGTNRHRTDQSRTSPDRAAPGRAAPDRTATNRTGRNRTAPTGTHSDNADRNSPDTPHGPHPILSLLKREGDRSAADLALRLGTSTENVRQQLSRLAAGGLVRKTSAPGTVGRPRHIWSLTPAAAAQFPDAHADLATRMLHAIRQTFGETALSRLISLREAEDKQRYSNELSGLTHPADRIARLARLRSEEGYMADWQRNPDGSFDLIENHCPIRDAAGHCVEFCAAELAVFRSCLPDAATIERTEHILCGDRRCVCRITLPDQPASGSPSASASPPAP